MQPNFMTAIVSRRHYIKFYLSIALGTAFFVAIGSALLFIYYRHASEDKLQIKNTIMLLFGLACYALAVYSLYRYNKNVPKIILDGGFISFDDQVYAIADINRVRLTGKQPFLYIVDFPMEAAMITFSNGDTKYIFDDMYSNSWEIKSFLKQVIIDKKDFHQQNAAITDKNTGIGEVYETFAGNQLTSLKGIVLWVPLVFFVYIFLFSAKQLSIASTAAAICLVTFWFIVHSYQMNYFQVSDRLFVVKSHNYFWQRKVYHLADIKEIVFETQGKMPNCLRIITKDFRNKLYPAATLRDKTWLDLKRKLRQHKIKVRNECI